MAVAAEQLWEVEQHQDHYLASVPDTSYSDIELPLVIEAAELQSDELIRRRAARFIGSVLLEESVELENTVRQDLSLLDALHEARNGNEQARKMVQINAATDVMERTFKAGHVTEVILEQDDNGTLFQYGQSMQEVYANSFRYMDPSPQMHKRLEAEALNGHRIQSFANSGQLEDYSFVVFSLAPDDMTTKEAAGEGFFTDSMSGVIQVTTKKGNDITIESAFVAGRQDERSVRHDKSSVVGLLRELGIEYENLSVTEMLSKPLLINNSLIPNGVVDIVERYDRQTDSFFGQQQPTQPYDTYLEVCRQREQSMKSVSDRVAERLIAATSSISSPALASALLNKISEEETLNRALIDMTIDPIVYGKQAAQHINAAREHIAEGNIAQGLESMQSAKKTATSSSCAGNLRLNSSESLDSDSASSATCKEVKDGEHVRCPGCMKMVRAIVPDKETIFCSNKECKLAHPRLK